MYFSKWMVKVVDSDVFHSNIGPGVSGHLQEGGPGSPPPQPTRPLLVAPVGCGNNT